MHRLQGRAGSRRHRRTLCRCERQHHDRDNLNFVFKFRKTHSRPSPDTEISGHDVYQCRQIVARQQAGQLDWAIVRVDRVIDAPQVSIRTSDMPAPTVGVGLTLIGHPAGLPLKIASGGKFLSFQENTFRSDLDAYGGNSGSPIFNTQALERGELLVEGILQGGSDDYVDWCNNPSSTGIMPAPPNPCNCAVSYRCSFSADAAKACRGEIGVYARHMERTLSVGGGGTGVAAAGRFYRPKGKEYDAGTQRTQAMTRPAMAAKAKAAKATKKARGTTPARKGSSPFWRSARPVRSLCFTSSAAAAPRPNISISASSAATVRRRSR